MMVSPQQELTNFGKATLFREGEPPIYLLGDGRFTVNMGGRWEVRTTLKAIEKVRNAVKPSIKIHTALPGEHDEIVEAVGIDGRIIIRVDGARIRKGYRPWYVYDAERAAKLEDLERRKDEANEAFKAEERQIMEDARIVNQHNFEEVLRCHLSTATSASPRSTRPTAG